MKMSYWTWLQELAGSGNSCAALQLPVWPTLVNGVQPGAEQEQQWGCLTHDAEQELSSSLFFVHQSAFTEQKKECSVEKNDFIWPPEGQTPA